MKLRLPNLASSLPAGAQLVVALAILFTAQLHLFLTADQLLAGCGLLFIALARILPQLKAKMARQKAVLAQAGLEAAAGVMLLTVANTAYLFVLILTIWAAATFVFNIVCFFKTVNREPEQKLFTVLPLILTMALLISGTDLVAAVGWFGAYAVVVGVFGLIAACDKQCCREKESDAKQ